MVRDLDPIHDRNGSQMSVQEAIPQTIQKGGPREASYYNPQAHLTHSRPIYTPAPETNGREENPLSLLERVRSTPNPYMIRLHQSLLAPPGERANTQTRDRSAGLGAVFTGAGCSARGRVEQRNESASIPTLADSRCTSVWCSNSSLMLGLRLFCIAFFFLFLRHL